MRVKLTWLALGLLTAPGVLTAAPATTQADSTAPSIHWPTGWDERKPTVSGITQYAVNGDSGAGADYSAMPVSDYADGLSIADFAAHRLELLKATTTFKKLNPVVGPVRPARVGGLDAAVVEIQMVVNQVKSHYEYVYFRKGDFFCRLAVWSVPSKWPVVQPLADSLVDAVQ